MEHSPPLHDPDFYRGDPYPTYARLRAEDPLPRAGQAVDGEALRTRLKADLSAYKVPRHIWVRSKDELPLTESGKLKKLELSRRMADLAG